MTAGEHLAFLAWDDASGLVVRVQLTARDAPASRTASVLAWVGARPVYAFGLAVDEATTDATGDLAVGGLRARAVGSGAWQLELTDGSNGMSLRFEAFGRDIAHDLPPALALAHDVSACRVTGRVDLSGHGIDVAGVGHRSRSTGTRDLDALAGRRDATGFLGASARAVGAPATELVFQVREVDTPDGGRPAVSGFVHAGGVDLRLEAVTAADGDPLHLELAVAGGRRFTVRGHPHGVAVPVRPAGDSEGSTAVVHLQLVRWEADGLDGYGLVERLADRDPPPTIA